MSIQDALIICVISGHFVNYRAVHQPSIIPGVGKVLSAIGTGNVLLTVKTRSGKRNKVMLFRVLHVPNLFTNLILGSKLLKKGYYMHGRQQTVNSCTNNIEIPSTPVQDELFAVRLYKAAKKKRKQTASSTCKCSF